MITISEKSLDWAINHARNYGDTDILPTPFEYEALQNDWGTIKAYLTSQDALNWNTRPPRTLLAPKSRYAFRAVTQLDPLDFLMYAAIVFEIGKDLESKRIPQSDETVYSFRFAPDKDGRMFDPTTGYRQFQLRCETLASGKFSQVVIADIADFYPRIYVHRLENALNNATKKGNHVKAITNLLSGWNGTESYGIPVGNAMSRLLAEVTISDVDNLLKAYGVTFARFNDDYRLFATDKNQAYRILTVLADHLYTNHGLTLQPQKTRIVDIDDFRGAYLPTAEDRAFDAFQTIFQEVAANLGLDNNYERIEWDDLDEELQNEINGMNLGKVFREEISKGDDADLGAIRFLIRRLAQLGDDEIMEDIFANLETLHPALSDIIKYLESLRSLSAQKQKEIGSRVLDLLQSSIITEMPHHRMWVLTLFSESTGWDNQGRFLNLLSTLSDHFSRRKLILALGRSRQTAWFQSRWRSLFDEAHWCRRALLLGASCMPADARKHWYDSVEPRLDQLEKAVVKYARQNPFAD